jgi:predicted nucleic acid-binding protein
VTGIERAEYFRTVIDSFALISFLFGEAGAPRVQEVLEEVARKGQKALFSIISLGEVAYIIERREGLAAAQAALSAIESLPLELAVADRSAVLASAHVKAHNPISYADAFVVAVSLAQNAIILTGDPEFKSVEELVTVEWLPA